MERKAKQNRLSAGRTSADQTHHSGLSHRQIMRSGAIVDIAKNLLAGNQLDSALGGNRKNEVAENLRTIVAWTSPNEQGLNASVARTALQKITTMPINNFSSDKTNAKINDALANLKDLFEAELVAANEDPRAERGSFETESQAANEDPTVESGSAASGKRRLNEVEPVSKRHCVGADEATDSTGDRRVDDESDSAGGNPVVTSSTGPPHKTRVQTFFLKPDKQQNYPQADI